MLEVTIDLIPCQNIALNIVAAQGPRYCEVELMSSPSQCQEVIGWEINYGDGSNISTSPNHSYSQSGQYTISGTYWTFDGVNCCSNNFSVPFEALEGCDPCNDVFFADFSTNYLGNGNYKFSENGISGSGYTNYTYVWDFGDGTSQTGGSTVYHYYPNAGTYNVTLTVFYFQNGSCCHKTISHEVITTHGSGGPYPQNNPNEDNDENSEDQSLNLLKNLDSETLNSNFEAFPNPSEGLLTISLNDGIIRGIKIYNSSAVLVEDISNQNDISEMELNLESYNPGLYIITLVTSEGENLSKSIVIE
jgi:hypothetical protein